MTADEKKAAINGLEGAIAGAELLIKGVLEQIEILKANIERLKIE